MFIRLATVPANLYAKQNNFNYFDSALTRAFSAAKIILYIGLMIACRIETARSEG